MDKAVPTIRILEYEKAVEFYCNKLGFEITFEWRHEPGFPVYMGIKKDTLYAHLSEHKGDGEPGGGRGMVLLIKDIDIYYKELKKNGVVFDQELKLQPWGSKDFIFRDPFDNRIGVTERTSE